MDNCKGRFCGKREQRTASFFVRAAHDCFDKDVHFLRMLEQMPYGEIEEFFSFPRLILGFSYLQDPNDKQKCLMAQRIVCKRLIDCYVFDLMNGLRHGHGPSRCRNCHRYFLTTTAHVPKYCDGMAPQDSRLTCRQYGAMTHQKEQNRQHPVYRIFSTRTNTIRKHHHRGNISDELRREALRLAEVYRDKALLDNDYAAGNYVRDMEQEQLYGEARKRVREKEGGSPVTKQSISAAGDSPANEELVRRLQDGDGTASELLLHRNRGYITALAIRYGKNLCGSSQELAIRMNYNGPSGAEKAYKSAIRKLKRHLHGGAYGVWLDI